MAADSKNPISPRQQRRTALFLVVLFGVLSQSAAFAAGCPAVRRSQEESAGLIDVYNAKITFRRGNGGPKVFGVRVIGALDAAEIAYVPGPTGKSSKRYVYELKVVSSNGDLIAWSMLFDGLWVTWTPEQLITANDKDKVTCKSGSRLVDMKWLRTSLEKSVGPRFFKTKTVTAVSLSDVTSQLGLGKGW